MTLSERYIVGDWGTTRLRLYLIEQGQVAAVREGAGIGRLQAAPAEVLLEETRPWVEPQPSVDVMLGGMASSRGGLQELPYVRVAAGAGEWMRGAKRIAIGPLNVVLATGVQCGGPADGFDVMRGEEAQIFGAIQIQPALGLGSQRLVLPGTHTKWVNVADAAITQFRTAITGELYALLREHSTLLKANPHEPDDPEQFDQGFDAGTTQSMAANVGLLSVLFRTRTEQLLQDRTRSWASGFLSGLLIGYEMVSMLKKPFDSAPLTIIGAPSLAVLYQRALAGYGVSSRVLDGAQCACRGLQLLRDQYL
jgi:2-dehydro-3-deoxygalactonokinase